MTIKKSLPVVCPICLHVPEFCRLLGLLEALKWAPTLAEGITITRALSLRHHQVCHQCRQPLAKCGSNYENDQCTPRRTSLQCGFPHWFVWDELLPYDKEYVHHANG